MDCVKGDRTEQEIQNLKKLTCEANLKRPECQSVPKILRPDCDNLPKKPGAVAIGVCVPITVGAITASVVSFTKLFGKGIKVSKVGGASKMSVAGQSLVRFFPLIAGGVAGGRASLLTFLTLSSY